MVHTTILHWHSELWLSESKENIEAAWNCKFVLCIYTILYHKNKITSQNTTLILFFFKSKEEEKSPIPSNQMNPTWFNTFRGSNYGNRYAHER